jgi:hypothetical protein
MVTTPMATGDVGGSDLKSSVIERKTPAARQNAASQTSAPVMRS